MKAPVFLDTGYVLAVLNTRDKYHKSASNAASKASPPFVTTEAVLIEIGNALAKTQWRAIGVATIHNLRSAQDIEIVPVDTALLERTIDFYSSRTDKDVGTD